MNLHTYLRYERFVFALEEASRDMLPILKDKALKVSLCHSVLFVCLCSYKSRSLIDAS